jgi:putative ATPase
MSGSLFSDDAPETGPVSPAPLAERLRPQTLDEIVGQEHLLGPGKPLRTAIERDQVPSMILWGPPGVGKTTLAQVIAKMTKSDFVPFSAVLSGIKEIKEVMTAAERTRRLGRRTILFVDEIHRFNKAQQDAFLPHVERGNVVLIGATTENPSFEVNSALLSRARVFVLKALTDEHIESLVRRAADAEKIPVGRCCAEGYGFDCERRCPHRTQYSGTRVPHLGGRRADHSGECATGGTTAVALRQGRRRTLQHHFSTS